MRNALRPLPILKCLVNLTSTTLVKHGAKQFSHGDTRVGS